MTRLTSDTALRLMLHSAIMPSIDVRIMPMVATTSSADQTSKPSNTNDMSRMALMLALRLIHACLPIVRYCS